MTNQPLITNAATGALCYITGGGFVDNIPRVLPKSLAVVIKKGSWDMLPIFQIIAEKSGVPDEELYQVFNMGIGMIAIVSADQADAALKIQFARSKSGHTGLESSGGGGGEGLVKAGHGRARRGWQRINVFRVEGEGRELVG